MSRLVVYPGSFDPITLGHIDIVERVSPHLDRLIVLVSYSPEKSYLFNAEERLELARSCLSHLQNVEVDSHKGLTVDYLKRVGAQVLLRGLRAVADFEYEVVAANMNKKFNAWR